MRIINQKNITINQKLVVNTEFKKNITLNFQPDQMNVKQITLVGDRAALKDGVVVLFCPTINETLGSFFDGSSVNPQLSFYAKNFTNQTEWTFRVIHVQTGAISGIQEGDLSFQLEFLQFSDK
jgi:hypothetical protein